MGLISLTLPNDGETVDAADVNTPFNTIATVINGNIENANIKSDAAIDGTKIADNSIPATKMKSGAEGWTGLANTPNTVTYNGNRNYDLVFNSVDISNTLSPGMKIRLQRTVAAPTKCTDLEAGSSQYYSKTSPAGMTFTDDFVCSAWVKLESYASVNNIVASRYNGTSGWQFGFTASGQIFLQGFNGGASNTRYVYSYASIPLNKWVHITAQLDMSLYTTTTTTCYVMIDGIDVPAGLAQSGTNPTSLIQAGDLQIGAGNTTNYFDGKLAQVAIFNAKVTQATMRTYMSQGLSGSETSLISAYSFDNSINDLNTTNANNLTANGSAVATDTDSPFANAVSAGLQEYAEVNSVTFSTNTTVNVRVPDACLIPTSGGITNVYYAVGAYPYGLPYFNKLLGIAEIKTIWTTTATTATAVSGLSTTVYIPTNAQVKITAYAGGLKTSAVAGTTLSWIINDGSNNVANSIVNEPISAYNVLAEASCVITPSSGLKTFSVKVDQDGAGTITVEAGKASSESDYGPAYIIVELV